jgi:hypothetical protein
MATNGVNGVNGVNDQRPLHELTATELRAMFDEDGLTVRQYVQYMVNFIDAYELEDQAWVCRREPPLPGD